MGTAGTDTHANNNTDASINAKVTCTDTLHSEDEAHAAHEANPWLFLKPPAKEIPSQSFPFTVHVHHSSNQAFKQPTNRSITRSINQSNDSQSIKTNKQSVSQSVVGMMTTTRPCCDLSAKPPTREQTSHMRSCQWPASEHRTGN